MRSSTTHQTALPHAPTLVPSMLVTPTMARRTGRFGLTEQHLPDSPEHKDGNTNVSHPPTSLVTPQKTIEQDSPPMSESYSLIDSFLKDRHDQEKEEKRVLEDTIRREVERKRKEEDEERRVRVAGIGERASGMNEKDRAVSLFFLFRVAKHLLKQAKREVKRETERKRKEQLERDIHNQTTPERFVVPSQTVRLHRSETRSHVPFLYPFTHTQQDTSHQRPQQTHNEERGEDDDTRGCHDHNHSGVVFGLESGRDGDAGV
ncbi:hypothetical protein BLNAU_21642 [Blattamonas nauphoetae]|uniref:Pinin/SDK/MemA protein domain-containing protein n=1 Tax=Blattamonas nauphoetae TaxID=2049346 RepID=A0ABQ9WVD1_9EUKA|nr:hypothetical protein BLNAU_21642 [Blattamonas nauphoetae]